MKCKHVNTPTHTHTQADRHTRRACTAVSAKVDTTLKTDRGAAREVRAASKVCVRKQAGDLAMVLLQ